MNHKAPSQPSQQLKKVDFLSIFFLLGRNEIPIYLWRAVSLCERSAVPVREPQGRRECLQAGKAHNVRLSA
jgi:hypothetical protein